jgi:enoyl-CoA hydratase
VSSIDSRERVLDRALEIATNLALGSQQAIRGTKRSLNMGWLTAPCPSMNCRAVEFIGLTRADYLEARQAFCEKQPPRFPSAQGEDR